MAAEISNGFANNFPSALEEIRVPRKEQRIVVDRFLGSEERHLGPVGHGYLRVEVMWKVSKGHLGLEDPISPMIGADGRGVLVVLQTLDGVRQFEEELVGCCSLSGKGLLLNELKEKV
ncbi:hypothetical protein HAX54_012622 [Datura stramonium]|uniref:Uncharacterized protein n=1 Tax=Datura stramonium TaxID=4076 RepID=A0ABS8RY95_DATST|nr:hypothetical protein [Datura stramonium]